jgi:hypothetical protein
MIALDFLFLWNLGAHLMLQTTVFWSLENQDARSLPEIMSKRGGEITYIDTQDGQRLYSVRDWVYYVSASKNKNLSAPWSDLKKAIRRKGLESLLGRIQTHELQTPGGKQVSDFADQETLMEIKKYVEQTRQDKTKSEVINFHPQVISFLQHNGWQTRHHINLQSGRTVDIIAYNEARTLVIECKPNLLGQRLFTAIGQVLCYTVEYGGNSYPALATSASQVSEYVQLMCSAQSIELICIPNL